MDLLNLVRANREKIFELAAKHGAYNVRLFGSVARGDSQVNSDIDFLVDFKPQTGLLEWCGLRLDLVDLLGCDVDVATETSLKPRLKTKVLNEAVSL